MNTKAWAEWLKLETFNDPELIQMVDACGRFLTAFKTENYRPFWLSLLGDTGSGKTHCANKVWEWASARCDWHRMHQIHRPIYWPKLVRDLKAQEAYELIDEMARWPIVFIDDIGADRDTSGFATEQLNALLGQRVGKWTILTSNMGVAQLAKLDVRIADRIIREPGNQFVEVKTVSYGVRKAKQ